MRKQKKVACVYGKTVLWNYNLRGSPSQGNGQPGLSDCSGSAPLQSAWTWDAMSFMAWVPSRFTGCFAQLLALSWHTVDQRENTCCSRQQVTRYPGQLVSGMPREDHDISCIWSSFRRESISSMKPSLASLSFFWIPSLTPSLFNIALTLLIFNMCLLRLSHFFGDWLCELVKTGTVSLASFTCQLCCRTWKQILMEYFKFFSVSKVIVISKTTSLIFVHLLPTHSDNGGSSVTNHRITLYWFIRIPWIFILLAALWDKRDNLQFSNEKKEAQKGYITPPGSHRQHMAE